VRAGRGLPQAERGSGPADRGAAAPLAVAAYALLWLQVALGGWVSTNYAVLACSSFPTCQGSWWPAMDFAQGFELWRELGKTGAGEHVTFAALTAIHYVHRLMAYACSWCWALAGLALRRHAALRREAAGSLLLALWQFPPACRTWSSAGRWWPRWRTPAAPRPGGGADLGAAREPRASASPSAAHRTTGGVRMTPHVRQFYALTKPRVVQLIVFCALIGMVLAVPGLPSTGRTCAWPLIACAGIWLVAGAAAAFNCLVEKGIDAKMRRTAWRPPPRAS
jgi:hypothetical protein